MTLIARARAASCAQRMSATRQFLRLVSIVTVGMLGIAGFTGTNPFTIRVADAVTAWTFVPSDGLIADADTAGFTADARYLFLASKPLVTFADDLAASCGARPGEQALLGCFDPRDRSIHLLSTPSPELRGLEAVTASHELLHAVWYRLTDAERERLGQLLWAHWAALSSDPSFAAHMASYAEADRADFVNELHSVLATDAVRLDPELENHYRRYFTDRHSLVRLSATSIAAFDRVSSQRE